MQKQKEETTEVLETLERKQKIKKLLIIAIISVLLVIIVFLGVSFYLYFKSPEKQLSLGANIEKVLISEDNDVVYIKLAGGINYGNITKVKFIFKDKEGNEHVYETSEGTQEISVPFKRSFWQWLFGKEKYEGVYDYEINSEDVGLNDFSNINEVSVSFEYETETNQTIITSPLDTTKPTPVQNKTTTPSPGGGGGYNPPSTICTPEPKETTCGTWVCGIKKNNCNEDVDCGNCGSGEKCENGNCKETIECLNNSDCDAGYICINNKCEFNCIIGENCFYVSVTGNGSHNESLGNEMNLSEAQSYANSNTDKEITFLLAEGSYGELRITNNNRTAWATYKSTPGENAVFSRIWLGQWNGPYDLHLIFDGITAQDKGDYGLYDYVIWLQKADNIKFLNSKIISKGYRPLTYPTGMFIDGGSNVLVESCNITGNGSRFKGGFVYGIRGGGKNVVIRNCEIDQAGSTAISIAGPAENWTIESNHLFHLDGDAIVLSLVSNILIKNNTVHDLHPPIYFEENVTAYYNDSTKNITIVSGPLLPAMSGEDWVRLTLSNGSYVIRSPSWQWHRITATSNNTITISPAVGEDYTDIIKIEILSANIHGDPIQFNYYNTSNISIIGNKIYDSFGQCFWLNPSSYSGYLLIEGNLVYNCDSEGLVSGEIAIGNCGDEIIIRKNTFDASLYASSVNISEFSENIVKIMYVDIAGGINLNNEDYNIWAYEYALWMGGYTHGTHTLVLGNANDYAKYKDLFVDYINYDLRPRIDSVACNGSINPPGVAVGALPCVCTNDSQCIEVFGGGYVCESEKCVETSVCGNNIKEASESCDGTDLAGETCQSRGFDSGNLSCSSDCLSFDTNDCKISGVSAGLIIINHTAVDDFEQIPDYWLDKAKELTIHYCTQSHGSQVNNGMLNIENVIDPKYNLNMNYAWHDLTQLEITQCLPPVGASPALRMCKHGAQPQYYWYTQGGIDNTTIMANSGLYNYSMFMWCGEHGSYSDQQIQDYLDTMDMFEQEYPNMRFIYATGHSGFYNIPPHNAMIRNYAITNNKVFFDVEDIEHYDPDGNYYPNEDSTCTWCENWCSNHPADCQDLLLPDCMADNCCPHTHGFLCRMKAKAMWVLMAKLAGWNGTPSCPTYHSCEAEEVCQDGVCVSGVGMGSLSPFTKLWNWLKGLLTRETGKAILTGNAITGNVVSDANIENLEKSESFFEKIIDFFYRGFFHKL